jgi:hypothetical protein
MEAALMGGRFFRGMAVAQTGGLWSGLEVALVLKKCLLPPKIWDLVLIDA